MNYWFIYFNIRVILNFDCTDWYQAIISPEGASILPAFDLFFVVFD